MLTQNHLDSTFFEQVVSILDVATQAGNSQLLVPIFSSAAGYVLEPGQPRNGALSFCLPMQEAGHSLVKGPRTVDKAVFLVA